MFAAVLDTCVLYPSRQRDALLSFAAQGLYRPVWSSVILDELRWAENQKLVEHGSRGDDAARRADRLITAMRRAFVDAETPRWEGLDGTFGLPDPNDEHVVAMAVVAGAGAIVTDNIRDFPRDRLPAGIDVQAAAVLRTTRSASPHSKPSPAYRPWQCVAASTAPHHRRRHPVRPRVTIRLGRSGIGHPDELLSPPTVRRCQSAFGTAC